MSAPCAQQSEPSEASPLHRSGVTLPSFLGLRKNPAIPIRRRTDRSINRTSDPNLTHTQPLIAFHPRSNRHITTTRRAFQHTSFPIALPCVHTTTPLSIECRYPALRETGCQPASLLSLFSCAQSDRPKLHIDGSPPTQSQPNFPTSRNSPVWSTFLLLHLLLPFASSSSSSSYASVNYTWNFFFVLFLLFSSAVMLHLLCFQWGLSFDFVFLRRLRDTHNVVFYLAFKTRFLFHVSCFGIIHFQRGRACLVNYWSLLFFFSFRLENDKWSLLFLFCSMIHGCRSPFLFFR